jgi:hypothetical protein
MLRPVSLSLIRQTGGIKWRIVNVYGLGECFMVRLWLSNRNMRARITSTPFCPWSEVSTLICWIMPSVEETLITCKRVMLPLGSQ